MKNIILQILNIFNIFSIVNSNNNILSINQKSIITFSYKNNNPNPSSINLNNNFYRESSLLPYNNGIFSLEINKGKYKINSDNINSTINIEYGKMLKTNSKLKSKILNKNKLTDLEKISYYYHKDHKIKITSMVNLVKYEKKYGKFKIIILINNKVYFQKNFTNNVMSFYSNPIKLKKGNNKIELKGISYDNIWCSCTEATNGFNYGRHLTSWIINDNLNNESNKIKRKDTIKNYIKTNIVKYNNNTCNKKNKNYYNQNKISNINIIQNKINFNFLKLLIIQY